jgi:hypothetical protein
VANLDLSAILAAARAAKAEAGSGEWGVGPAFTRHSEGRTWTSRDVVVFDHGPVAENCRAAIAAHIAVSDPDAVIALVERVQAAEAARDAAVTASYEHGKARGAAERELNEARAQVERWMDKAADYLGAYQDAAEMLAEVARERDLLAEDLAWRDAIHEGLVEGFHADIAARDASIDALTDRIRLLLAADPWRGFIAEVLADRERLVLLAAERGRTIEAMCAHNEQALKAGGQGWVVKQGAEVVR